MPDSSSGTSTSQADRQDQTREIGIPWSRVQESLVDSVNVMLDVLDTDGNVLFWNKGAEKISGYSREEVVGHDKIWEWLYPDLEYRQMLVSSMDVVWKDGVSEDGIETSIRCKDGQTRIIAWNDRVVADETGKVIGSVSIGRDITEQQENEKTLQEHAELQATLRRIDQTILESQSPQEIAQVVLHDLKSLVPCDLAKVIVFDLVNNRSSSLAVCLDGEIGAGTGQSHSLEQYRIIDQFKTGQTVYLPGLDTDLLPPAELHLLRNLGVNTLVSMPLLVGGDLIGLLNLGWRETGAVPPVDVKPAQELVNVLAISIRQVKLHQEIELHAAEQEKRVAERTAELRMANADLARTARAKDEFLANMSHELRTPLAVILGKAETLQEELHGPLNEKQQKCLGSIHKNGQDLLEMVTDILDMAKIGAGSLDFSMGTVDALPVCRASLRLVKQLAFKKRINPAFSFDRKLSPIQADERRLKQILTNLLSNAIKFTPEGGQVGLEVVGDREDDVARFTVWDTGIGIAAQDVPRLFEPFTQLDTGLGRQYTGTGLGLALVQQLVDIHGGSIAVESEFGKGSRFTVSLPWQEPDADAKAGHPDGEAELGAESLDGTDASDLDSGEQESTPATILLAEDNEDNIEFLSDYLTMQGYRVENARSGREAIEQAQAIKPDLILMDVQMPDLDGLEAIRRLRASQDLDLVKVPIVALTGLAMPGDRQRCVDAGANDYLSKPVRLKTLIQVIEDQLNRQETN